MPRILPRFGLLASGIAVLAIVSGIWPTARVVAMVAVLVASVATALWLATNRPGDARFWMTTSARTWTSSSVTVLPLGREQVSYRRNTVTARSGCITLHEVVKTGSG